MTGRDDGSQGGKERSSRRARAVATHVESLDLRTRDGWFLRADVHTPEERTLGVVVLAHALMSRRTSFSRPRSKSVVAFLVGRGWRVIAFDFRGHGDSQGGPKVGKPRGYDDFVEYDLAAVGEFAREQAATSEPVVIIGHSLGGHAAFAALGTQPTQATNVDALVGIASAPPFLRADEPSRSRWLLKRATFLSMLVAARRAGRFPARALRLGSDDETIECCEDLERFARTGRWTSRDGRNDYLHSLANVRIPVLQVVSTSDRFECVPECGERFVARCGGPREVMRITRADGGGRAPGHMGLVTSEGARGLWDEIEQWMRRVTLNKTDGRRPSERSSLDSTDPSDRMRA